MGDRQPVQVVTMCRNMIIVSKEIWSSEQLYSAISSTDYEDERPDTAAKVGSKLEMHNQIVLKINDSISIFKISNVRDF